MKHRGGSISGPGLRRVRGGLGLLAPVLWMALPALLATTFPGWGATEEIRPPFGFQWGETSERVEHMLTQAKARVVNKENTSEGVRLTVEGISQRLLQRAFFSFNGDSLEEIELHYGDGAWDFNHYNRFFDQTRRHIDQRYGAGRLIARTKTTQNGVTHSLIGYQWTQFGATLQLFFFSAEKDGHTVKVLSLHYRAG